MTPARVFQLLFGVVLLHLVVGELFFETPLVHYLGSRIPKMLVTRKLWSPYIYYIGRWDAGPGTITIEKGIELNSLSFDESGPEPVTEVEIIYHGPTLKIKSFAYFLFLFAKDTYISKNFKNRFIAKIHFNKEKCTMRLSELKVDQCQLNNKNKFCRWCSFALMFPSNKKEYARAIEMVASDALTGAITTAMKEAKIEGFYDCNMPKKE